MALVVRERAPRATHANGAGGLRDLETRKLLEFREPRTGAEGRMKIGFTVSEGAEYAPPDL
jgi:hypothetical protein